MSARLIAIAGILALSAGCASNPQIPKETKIPVPVPCIDERIERPDFVSDADLSRMDDFELPVALAADRLARKAYEGKLEAQVAGCQ